MSAKLRPEEIFTERKVKGGKDLRALHRIYSQATENLRRYSDLEFEDDEALERQDLALEAQMHVMATVARTECGKLEDALTKFGIWMDDYRQSGQKLPEESESLLLSVYLDLQNLAEKQVEK